MNGKSKGYKDNTNTNTKHDESHWNSEEEAQKKILTKDDTNSTSNSKGTTQKKYHLPRYWNRVSINGGVVVNVMSFLTSKKPGKNMEDLIPTNMKMASFTGEKSNALWSSYSRCCGGTKGSEICLLCHGRLFPPPQPSPIRVHKEYKGVLGAS
ncbi:hypothetical protein MTR_4g111910 [Medicago truncatula]|uniref:Uncharacterized protein n=1 Tax=Medicago truncatula TaxID=3880 RepID=G7JRZ5_MEDTR|nr:hypothetical protein MTR_4g111910 [Medicago truncatula]